MPTSGNAPFDVQLRDGRVVVATDDYEVFDALDDALAVAQVRGLAFRLDVPCGSERTCHDIIFPEELTDAQVRHLLSTLPGVPGGSAV
jgi:hypothetical protein